MRPASASTLAKVVPQEPAPRTVSRSRLSVTCPASPPGRVRPSPGEIRRAPRRPAARAVRPSLVVELGRRGDAADLADHVPDGGHDPDRRGADGPGVIGSGPQVGQVDRFAERGVHVLAGQRVEPAALHVGGVDLVGAPVGHRDHREVAGQGERADPHPGLHRPHVGVPGDGAVRVDQHHAAGVQRGRRGVQAGLPGAGAGPIDRNLVRSGQGLAQHRHLPQRRLGHEPRDPAGLADGDGVEQRVQVRDVVGDQEVAAAASGMLRAGDLLPAQQERERIHHDLAEGSQALPFSYTGLRATFYSPSRRTSPVTLVREVPIGPGAPIRTVHVGGGGGR